MNSWVDWILIFAKATYLGERKILYLKPEEC